MGIGRSPRSNGNTGWLHALAGSEPSLTGFHDLYEAFAERSKLSPLTLVIDDVDLADAASTSFLLYLIERLWELPIAIVLASGAISRRHTRPVLGDIARHPLTTRRRITPLTPAETAERVTARWPVEMDDRDKRGIHDASGGNPFLIDELMTALASSPGRPVASRVRELAPAEVAEWALAQAADLGDDTVAVMNALATLGREGEIRHLAALTRLDAETVATATDDLRDIGLLTDDARPSFAHPVVAASVAAALAPGERSVHQLEIAQLLNREEAPPELIACHLLEAARTGSAWVADTLWSAAVAALERGAPSRAAAYLRRALDEPPVNGERAKFTVELGRAEAMVGDPRAVARLADPLDDPSAALTAGRTLFALGRLDQARAAFQRGLASGRDADPDVIGALLADHAAVKWVAEMPNAEARRLGPAPVTNTTRGDRTLLALHAIEAATRTAPRAEVEDLARRALADDALLADETADGLPYYLAAGAIAYAERLDEAEAAIAAAVEDARRRGSSLGLAIATEMRAAVILMRGQLADAAAEAQRALAAAPDGSRFGLGGARAVLATTFMERGDVTAARRQLDAAGDSATVTVELFRLGFLRTRGVLHLQTGAPDDALADFMACGALADAAGATNPAIVAWRSSAGLALAAKGDLSEARRLIESELALARSFGAPRPIGRALRALARTEKPVSSRETLEEAVDVLRGSDTVLELAAAFVDYGSALRRSGRRREAREPLKEGLQLAERCGAERLATRALKEVNLAGARPRRRAANGHEALTAREREVASLAAAGLSNRRIAEMLVVTVKTVEFHLRHAYQKLGIRSRRELADVIGRS